MRDDYDDDDDNFVFLFQLRGSCLAPRMRITFYSGFNFYFINFGVLISHEYMGWDSKQLLLGRSSSVIEILYTVALKGTEAIRHFVLRGEMDHEKGEKLEICYKKSRIFQFL